MPAIAQASVGMTWLLDPIIESVTVVIESE